MNKYLFLFLTIVSSFGAQEGFRISGYPNKPKLTNTDLFITAAPGVTNNNISYAQLEFQLETNILNSTTASNRIYSLMTNSLLNEIHPSWFGAVGDGIHDDKAAFRAMATFIRAVGGATIRMEQDASYNVASVTNDYPLFALTNLSALNIQGNGAKFLVGDAVAYGSFIYLRGCTNITVKDLAFRSEHTNEVSNTKGPEWLVFTAGSQNIHLDNLIFIGGAIGYTCRGPVFGNDPGLESNRVRNGLVENCQAYSTYYPFLHQGAGDNWIIRNCITRNSTRAIFGSNVHDIEFDIDGKPGGAGFSEVFFNVYAATNWVSSCYNIKGKYRSSGMTPGVTQLAHNALVTLAAQTYQTGDSTPAVFQNIDIELIVTNTPTSSFQGLFAIVKYLPGPNGDADVNPRGHVFDNIAVHGVGRGMTNCTLFPIQICAWGGDNWTGDKVSNIRVGPFDLDDCYGKLAILANGAGFQSDKLGLIIDSVQTDGYLAIVTNNTTVGIPVINSKFTNLITHFDLLTSINGTNAVGVAAQMQNTMGGLGIGGRTRINGALDVSGNFQTFNKSFIISSGGSDTNSGPIAYMLHDGTNAYFQSSQFGAVTNTPIYIGINGIGNGIHITTNGAVTTQSGFTNNGVAQVNTGPIILSSRGTNGFIMTDDGTNAYIETFPVNGGTGRETLNLIVHPSLNAGGLRVETNGNITVQANQNTLGFVNSNTGYQYQSNATAGSYLRGNGANFVQSTILASDLTTIMGRGITNNGGVLSNNIVAGANITISSGASGQLTITGTSTNGGTVTNVALTVPTFLSVSGSPITTGGTLAVAYSGLALPVANGGTGGTSKSTALTGLGLNTGLGITNTGSIYSNNIVAGANTTITAGANGQLTIASTGGFTQPTGSGVVTVTGGVIDTASSPIQQNFNATDGTGGFLRNILPNINGAIYVNQDGGDLGTANGTYLGYAGGFADQFIFRNYTTGGGFQFYTPTVGGGGSLIIADDGEIRAYHLGGGLSPDPTVVKGPALGALGSSATMDSDANDVAFTVTAVVGTTPLANDVLFTVTFGNAFDVAPHVIYSPSNSTAVQNFATGGYPIVTTTGFTFNSTPAAMTAGQTYVWTFHVLK